MITDVYVTVEGLRRQLKKDYDRANQLIDNLKEVNLDDLRKNLAAEGAEAAGVSRNINGGNREIADSLRALRDTVDANSRLDARLVAILGLIEEARNIRR